MELLLEALPLGADELGAAEPLALVEPPAAESFFVASDDEAALEEDDGALGVVPEAALEELESFLFRSTEPEAEVELEPDGAVLAEPDGVVVEPDDEDDDAGGVVLETARSPLSQPASNPAPSARETATAKAESLICGPPWLG